MDNNEKSEKESNQPVKAILDFGELLQVLKQLILVFHNFKHFEKPS
jgi:hypothetical protein